MNKFFVLVAYLCTGIMTTYAAEMPTEEYRDFCSAMRIKRAEYWNKKIDGITAQKCVSYRDIFDCELWLDAFKAHVEYQKQEEDLFWSTYPLPISAVCKILESSLHALIQKRNQVWRRFFTARDEDTFTDLMHNVQERAEYIIAGKEELFSCGVSRRQCTDRAALIYTAFSIGKALQKENACPQHLTIKDIARIQLTDTLDEEPDDTSLAPFAASDELM